MKADFPKWCLDASVLAIINEFNAANIGQEFLDKWASLYADIRIPQKTKANVSHPKNVTVVDAYLYRKRKTVHGRLCWHFEPLNLLYWGETETGGDHLKSSPYSNGSCNSGFSSICGCVKRFKKNYKSKENTTKVEWEKKQQNYYLKNNKPEPIFFFSKKGNRILYTNNTNTILFNMLLIWRTSFVVAI